MEYILQGDYGGEEEGDYYDYQDEYNLVEQEEEISEEEELVDEDDRLAAINYVVLCNAHCPPTQPAVPGRAGGELGGALREP
jgi:hypothetical protein